MMRRLRPAVVAAGFFIFPLIATASEQQDALRLAQRIAAQGTPGTTVRLRAAPAVLPASVPLPKAALLGSVATDIGGNRGPGAVHAGYRITLYFDPSNRAAAVTAYENALRAAGWKAVDMMARLTIPHGGFTAHSPELIAWCSPREGSASILITAPPSDASVLDVNVEIGSMLAGMRCGAETRDSRSVTAVSFEAPFAKSPLPEFAAGSGLTIDDSGPAVGSMTEARVTSSLGLAAVFERFAKQLRDAGWAPGASASADTLRSQTFTKTAEGKPAVALLAVHALDATHYFALADVTTFAR
jgi:hypothetical protein